MAEKTVRVRMREGLTMPLPRDIVRNSSEFVCTPETPIEVVLDSRFVRRRLEAGDFVIVDEDPAAIGLPDTTPTDVAPAPQPEPTPTEEPAAEKTSFLGTLFGGGSDKE